MLSSLCAILPSSSFSRLSGPSRAVTTTAALMLAMTLTSLAPSDAEARKPRILLLGDSNFFGALGHRIADGLRANGYDVKLRARAGSGLAYPGFHDWETLAPALAERLDVDAVVMMFGGNDGQSLKPGRTDPGRMRVPWREDEAWRATYRERINRMASRIVADGRRFILLSPTNRRPRKARQRMQRIMQEQRAALDTVPRASWLDTWSPSSDSDGNYLQYGWDNRGRRQKFRAGDGIHLTRAGAADLAERMLPQLLEELGTHASAR